MARRKHVGYNPFKPDYPTNAHPPKCPTCGMRLPSDHAMVGVDEEAMHQRTRPQKKGRKGSRGVGGRDYSPIENNVKKDM